MFLLPHISKSNSLKFFKIQNYELLLLALVIGMTIPSLDVFASVSNSGKSLYVGDKEPTPQSIRFNNDGTKLFVIGNGQVKVHQYALTTPWDLSTATFTKSSSSLSAQDSLPLGLIFNSDGTKMFVAGNQYDRIYEYSLGAAFDVGTVTYLNTFLSVGAVESSPAAMAFNGDGTKFYLARNSDSKIYVYTLGTPYLPSSYSGSTYNSVDLLGYDIAFNSDGTKFYGIRGGANPLQQYSLTSEYDLSTKSGDAGYGTGWVFFDSLDSSLTSFTFSSDGSNVYVIGYGRDIIYQFTVDPVFDTVDSPAPTVSSAASGSSTSIVLTMSKTVVNNSALASNFRISGASNTPSVSSISVSGSSVTLNLSSEITSTDVLTVSYTQTSGNVYSTFGHVNLANFSNKPVTNNHGISSGGSSSHEHHTRPTFGISHENYQPIVTGGFSFNGKIFDIIDNWHTDFESQSVIIGQNNTFAAKVYAPHVLKIQEFLFGINQVGFAHNAELGVEVYYDYQGNIDDVKIVQDTDVVDIESFSGISYQSKCMSSSSAENCVVTQITLRFLEPLQYDIMAIKAIDWSGRTQITYLNEGFDISGDSLNPMITQSIAGPAKYEGSIIVTQNAKYSKYWTAEDGRVFEQNDYGTFTMVPQEYSKSSDSGEPLTRTHSEFSTLIQLEKINAHYVMKKLYPDYFDEPYDKINDIVLWTEMDRTRHIDYDEMKRQEMIAQQTMDDILLKDVLLRYNYE